MNLKATIFHMEYYNNWGALSFLVVARASV